VYEKGTYGRGAACFAPALMTLIAALLPAIGLPAGDARAAVDVTANVRVTLVARPASAPGSAQDFVVRDGGVLRSGDRVQLRLASDTDAYVYVIAYGSSNTAILLHPFSTSGGDALIRRGQEEIIPEAGEFLPLDGREGRETLFTVISDVQLPDISDLLPRIEAHGGDLTAITTMIEATYPFTRRLTFKHIGATPLVGVAAIAPRASASPEAPSPTAERQGTDGVAGASLPPPAGGGWSVPPTQDFGVSEAAKAGAATAAAGSSADSAEPMSASAVATETTPGNTGKVQASATVSEASPAPVSSARRKAREAAGIDEHEFRGILASLPDGSQVAVPDALRKPFEEQGVLSAEGSRIRALERAGLESDASWPSNDGGSRKKLQN